MGSSGVFKKTLNMNNSYMSDNKSVRTTGGGLANRLMTVLSQVARNFQNKEEEKVNDDDNHKL